MAREKEIKIKQMGGRRKIYPYSLVLNAKDIGSFNNGKRDDEYR